MSKISGKLVILLNINKTNYWKCCNSFCQIDLSFRTSKQNNAVPTCTWCKKTKKLVGAYRHPGKISGEISACGINLKQLAAVLVCKILATLYSAWWNFVVSVSTHWTIKTCCGKIQYGNCIIQHKAEMNINWETVNLCAWIKYSILKIYFTFQMLPITEKSVVWEWPYCDFSKRVVILVSTQNYWMMQ